MIDSTQAAKDAIAQVLKTYNILAVDIIRAALIAAQVDMRERCKRVADAVRDSPVVCVDPGEAQVIADRIGELEVR